MVSTDVNLDSSGIDGCLSPKLSHCSSASYLWNSGQLGKQSSRPDDLRILSHVGLSEPDCIENMEYKRAKRAQRFYSSYSIRLAKELISGTDEVVIVFPLCLGRDDFLSNGGKT